MRGFTIIETLVVIVVTGIVGVALMSMITNFYKSNAYLLQQSTAIDSAHRGLRVSFENLRQASYGEDGSYPLQTAATSSITFYSDVDNDGTVEKIRLYLLNGSLYRGVTDPSSSVPPSYTGQTERVTTIANYVRNSTSTPLFTFYDVDGVLMSSSSIDVSQVASISISVSVDLNPNRAPDILTFKETATLRNLRQ